MSNAYQYLDTEYTYINPKSGILYNLLGITEPEVLLFVESVVVTKKLQELYKFPIKIKGAQSLFEIHHLLFKDLYSWAGERRKVEISKDGKQFFPTSHFDYALNYIDQLISEFRNIQKSNKQQLSQKLAVILDNINFLHPFREGNGRTQREFLRLLALEKGLTLNLNPVDNSEVYLRYMKGTVQGDVDILRRLIFELI